MANIPTFNQITNYAETGNKLTNQYIISPILNLGIAGFVFDIKVSDSIEMRATSTDFFVENNSPVSDHIAIEPFRITVKGLIGELVYREEEEAGTTQELVEKLATLNDIVPQLTAGAIQARNAINANTTQSALDNGLNSATNLYATFRRLNPPDTAQARAVNFFRALFSARQLVGIETPYGFFNNLMIESLKVVQDQDNNLITDVEVTLKEFNFTFTEEIEFNEDDFQGRAKAQSMPVPENAKKGKGQEKDISLLKRAANQITELF